jgi:thiamine kinase-like enzyme
MEELTPLELARLKAKERLSKLSIWQGTPAFTVIEDGRTNCNFEVRDDSGRRYFARYGHDLPHHFIFREHEERAARLASDLNVAPKLLCSANGAMVCEFIEGKGLVIEDGLSKRTLERIADSLRRLHLGAPKGIEHVFDLAKFLPDYLGRVPPGSLPEEDKEIVIRIIESIPSLPAQSLIHSDLIPNNFLDDGKTMWIIDWEYAGLGHPAIDLAMIVSNFDLTPDLASFVIEAHGLCEKAQVEAMTPVLIVRELLWTLVQIGLVGLIGDLEEYRGICFKRLRACR